MEKVLNFFIYWATFIGLSYLLVYISNQGEGLLYAICDFIGVFIQFPTSKIDLVLMYFKFDWIICVLGVVCLFIKLIRNNL